MNERGVEEKDDNGFSMKENSSKAGVKSSSCNLVNQATETVMEMDDEKKSVNMEFPSTNEFYTAWGMEADLENDYWMIRNIPVVLRKWTPNSNLCSEVMTTMEAFWGGSGCNRSVCCCCDDGSGDSGGSPGEP
ncbi:hypothetical protein Tco_0153495 [Tanacetum coccineum]